MMTESAAPVRKSVTVRASPARAFAIFTDDMDSWWPRSHHVGKAPLRATLIEGRTGGRCYSQHEDATECDWGTVLVWEPPRRLVLAWQVSATWQSEPDLARSSEVEVTFTALDGGLTRVDLEHRHLDRVGANAAAYRAALDSPTAWDALLVAFATRASGPAGIASPPAPASL
jgi:uncharacterized protein YndB with AHSA1/START domain